MILHKVKQDNKQHGNKQPRQAFRQASKPQQAITRQARNNRQKAQKSLQDSRHKPHGQRPRLSHASKPEERTQAKRQAISLGQSKPPSMATATNKVSHKPHKRARNGNQATSQTASQTSQKRQERQAASKRHGSQANTLNTQTRLKPCTANGTSARLRNQATQLFCKAPDFIKTHQHPERIDRPKNDTEKSETARYKPFNVTSF